MTRIQPGCRLPFILLSKRHRGGGRRAGTTTTECSAWVFPRAPAAGARTRARARATEGSAACARRARAGARAPCCAVGHYVSILRARRLPWCARGAPSAQGGRRAGAPRASCGHMPPLSARFFCLRRVPCSQARSHGRCRPRGLRPAPPGLYASALDRSLGLAAGRRDLGLGREVRRLLALRLVKLVAHALRARLNFDIHEYVGARRG